MREVKWGGREGGGLVRGEGGGVSLLYFHHYCEGVYGRGRDGRMEGGKEVGARV